ncbi:MAG: succinate--CoA ligase subunit beta [Candidatus Methanomethylicaceae archaeon]
MQLFEYEAKGILQKAGIPVPCFHCVRSREQLAHLLGKISLPVMLKSQLLAKARAKAGLILVAQSPEEVLEGFRRLVGRVHNGKPIHEVLVEEKVQVAAELFLAVIVDYRTGAPILIASPKGGVDIESVAAEKEELILKVPISPSRGINKEQVSRVVEFLCQHLSDKFGGKPYENLSRVVVEVERLFRDYDCEVLEINPMAVTGEGKLIALDVLMIIDDDSLFRHPELIKARNQSEEEFKKEQELKRRGWTYISMDGDIGVLSSGAGITMAILDLIHFNGGKPANFLDTAQMDRKSIYEAFQLFQRDKRVKVLLVNIFAGLNRCDELALGIVDYLNDFEPPFPIVVRMIGNQDEKGRRILRDAGLEPIVELEKAVNKAIELAGLRG